MSFRKFITTHPHGDGSKVWYGNAYVMPNHYNHSLASFQALVAEARKDFPDLKDGEVVCRTVVKSSWCQGMPIIHFPCSPHTKKKDWHNCARLDFYMS